MAQESLIKCHVEMNSCPNSYHFNFKLELPYKTPAYETAPLNDMTHAELCEHFEQVVKMGIAKALDKFAQSVPATGALK